MFKENIIQIIDREGGNPMFEESNIFEEKMMSIDNHEDMERLIRRVGYFHMAFALKERSDKLNTHIRNNVSSNYILDELYYEIKRIGPCRVQDVKASQKLVLLLISDY